MDANKPGSTRQSKRLKQLQLPKTSFNSPLDLDSGNSHEDEKVQEQQILEPTVMANTTGSDDDDDFVNTIPQTKSNRIKKGDTGVRTAAGLQMESRSEKTADVPHLTPENIQATVQKTKRYKERAKKTIRIEEDRIRRKEMAKKRKINFQDVEEGMVKKKQINKTTKSKLGLVDEDLGTSFGSLFDFNLERIPHHLAFHILQSFDASSRSLQIAGKTLPITDIDVHEVLGLPIGQKSFTYAKTAARKNLWTSQFPGKPQNTSSYLLRDVLDYNIDLDNCCEYNWGELLLNSLVKTKNTWPTLSSLFYPGPIIFLTIFYVDRVIIKGNPEVERQFPTFKGWTVQILKQRHADEFKDDSFGKREIIRARWQIQNAKGNDAMTGKAPVSRQSQENEGNDAMAGNTHAACQPQVNEENDGPTCVSPSGQYEPTQKDWFDRLSIKTVMLMDAIELYKLELEAAKSTHPNNVEISDIEGKVIAEIQKLKQSDSKPQPQSEVKSVGEIENKNEEPNIDVTFEEHEEINPDVFEELELMEYIYSSQGIRDMNEYMDELSRPSFSLGIDSILDVCNQINKEHGDIQSNENDMVTPTPEECEKRTKRETKIGAAYRSPYVRRDINLGSKYSTQDYAVWRWLIQDGKDKYERVFQYGNVFYYRKHLATLSPSKKLYYCVVDVWSALMNEKETYKSAESPLRLFFDTGLSIGPLNKEKTEAEQYKIFVTGMNHFFEKYPNAKIKDYDLAKTWDVIDNIRQGKAANNEYAFILRRLKKHFVKYLKEKDMTWFATSISRMETSYLTMPWQTLQNVIDCGVFFMRHMETYKGDAKNWETQLKAEKKGNLQKGQLDKLRIKYAHAILTSHVNEKREFVIKESNLFYNKLEGEGLLKLVMESSQKKQPRKRNIEGTRLFEDE
ncbi:hypothetical protein POM88_001846 [Heracleum sosnowskyi]|uniref:Ubiquitin-like protease family profile domain-containing protein n=1 Tax=Heracleum sosnowskyi TaxID=360622 RepID=A0AAD8NB91_9APIA|nr:hypothetical protein POM88_001846 [Heracleum sosnowskyi]